MVAAEVPHEGLDPNHDPGPDHREDQEALPLTHQFAGTDHIVARNPGLLKDKNQGLDLGRLIDPGLDPKIIMSASSSDTLDQESIKVNPRTLITVFSC